MSVINIPAFCKSGNTNQVYYFCGMELSAQSKVWIYQANREFSEGEISELQPILHGFVESWTAHNQQLYAAAQVLYNRFIVLAVDETHAGASGCSIDKSVRLMKDIEAKFKVDLFDRFITAYKAGDQIVTANRTELEDLLKRGAVNSETIVFNNLVSSLADLQNKWQIPLKDSWHSRVFAGVLPV